MSRRASPGIGANTTSLVTYPPGRSSRFGEPQSCGVSEPWLPADDSAAHLGVKNDIVDTWIAERGMPAH